MFTVRDLVCLTVLLAMAADSSQQLSAGNGKFTAAFFDQLRGKPGNLFFSPISIQTVLALAHAGAKDRTATQIQQAAQLPDSRETSAKFFGDLMTSFQADDNVTLNLVNGMFVDKKFAVKPDYLDIIQKGFKAELGQVEFGNAREAANTINDFVAKNTNNKIKELFSADAFTPLTKLVLLNAIYFKGDWADKFPEANTKKGIFHLNEKEQKEVDYMQIKKKFFIQRNEKLDAQIVEISYKGEAVSMVLLVPNTVGGLANLESKLSGFGIDELLAGFSNKREVILTMPKFKLETTLDLNDLLIEMGAADLFSEKDANLSGIADLPLFVSKAVQKAFIEVNEAGSEAAAATGLKIQMRNMPLPALRINVDSPFLILIRSNGVNLFVGRVSNPIPI